MQQPHCTDFTLKVTWHHFLWLRLIDVRQDVVLLLRALLKKNPPDETLSVFSSLWCRIQEYVWQRCGNVDHETVGPGHTQVKGPRPFRGHWDWFVAVYVSFYSSRASLCVVFCLFVHLWLLFLPSVVLLCLCGLCGPLTSRSLNAVQ